MKWLGNLAITLLRSSSRLRYGLKCQTWKGPGYDIAYLENDKKIPSPSLLFLHGLGASKDQWGDHIFELTKDYHCIFIDLPGEGESGFSENMSYSLEKQVERLRHFIISKNINRPVFIGSSIGGAIATGYAVKFPEAVEKLIAIAPAGVKGEKTSDVVQEFVKSGNHPFGYRNIEEMHAFWQLLFDNPPAMPGFIEVALAEKGKKRYAKIDKIMRDFSNDGIYQLHEKISGIQARTLFIWGENDKVFDSSCASSARQEAPHTQVTIITDTGHVPYLERGFETVSQMKKFLVS